MVIDTSKGETWAVLKSYEILDNQNQPYIFSVNYYSQKLIQLDEYIILKLRIFDKFEMQPQKILFVNKETRMIQIYKEKLQKDWNLWAINGSYCVQCYTQPSNCKDVELTNCWLTTKFLYLHCLLHINDDFDDDLLFDCD